MELAFGHLSLSSLAIAGLALFSDLASADIILTEFMASNSTTLLDEDGASSDWIEIWNPNPFEIDLGGYYLTDDPSDLQAWLFPESTTVPGRGIAHKPALAAAVILKNLRR